MQIECLEYADTPCDHRKLFYWPVLFHPPPFVSRVMVISHLMLLSFRFGLGDFFKYLSPQAADTSLPFFVLDKCAFLFNKVTMSSRFFVV